MWRALSDRPLTLILSSRSGVCVILQNSVRCCRLRDTSGRQALHFIVAEKYILEKRPRDRNLQKIGKDGKALPKFHGALSRTETYTSVFSNSVNSPVYLTLLFSLTTSMATPCIQAILLHMSRRGRGVRVRFLGDEKSPRSGLSTIKSRPSRP